MYHRVRRRKMKYLVFSAILLLSSPTSALPRALDIPQTFPDKIFDDFDNDIIDFDDEYSVQYDKKLGTPPWKSNDFNQKSYRYSIAKDETRSFADKIKANSNGKVLHNNSKFVDKPPKIITEVKTTTVPEKTTEQSIIPVELLSTTENMLVSLAESTAEPDLTVIPLSTTEKSVPNIVINQTVTLPTSTQMSEDTTVTTETVETTLKDLTTTEGINLSDKTSVLVTEQITTEGDVSSVNVETTTDQEQTTVRYLKNIEIKNDTTKYSAIRTTTTEAYIRLDGSAENSTVESITDFLSTTDVIDSIISVSDKNDTTGNSSKVVELAERGDSETTESNEDLPIYTDLDDKESSEISEDYYDSKDLVPTTAPKTDALSVIFGFAGSVVESVVETVAERVVPKGLVDLFKRMQKQNEALEAERLRSREENGGLGQFTRGIIKTISTGISKPLSQLMAGVRDYGSLDSDRGFLNSLASGVTSVASAAYSMADAFKDRVQTIYPGTVWCGGGHSAQARSSELGLFFFTDTCCRQHDACKLYISSGDTKYGLTNTGLFTRSHCSCDQKFRECLLKTNSLVSTQIGLTYFNVLGPQCFRRAHPIVRCVRRTRITGQKCEEYELDYTKPKMWQWFDNETF